MKTKNLCLNGFFIALVCISTMLVQIPLSFNGGYVHLGDSIIMTISIFFGGLYGVIGASIGSFLADILSEYIHFSLFTLVIKGIMAYIIIKVADFDSTKNNFFSLRNIMACILGSIFMIFGYFLTSALLEGGFLIALNSIIPNVIQASAGFVIYLAIGASLQKFKVGRLISNLK